MRLAAFLIFLLISSPAIAQKIAAPTRANAAPVSVPSELLQAPNGAQSDLCSLPVAGGFGSPSWGLTVDWTHADKVCQAIRLNNALTAKGFRDAGTQVLCTISVVKEAMERAGTPCEEQKVAR